MSDLLRGTLVVSLEQAVAGPFASAKLAAAGARVIKVERPEGDFARGYDEAARGQSSYFVWLNRGKESVVLDFKDPEDARVLQGLVARADVFIQNLTPGSTRRAGFGSGDLRRRYPRLITCDISGYGETGPYGRMRAYDTLVQGEAGISAVTGHPDAPARVGISICDISAGFHAYAGILEALLRRERSGAGSGVKVSLFDCVADWMAVPYLHEVFGGRAPQRGGLHHPSIAPYGAYSAGGRQAVNIAIQNEREWERFCTDVLQQPNLVQAERFKTNSERVRNRRELDAVIGAVFERLSLSELERRLEAADIAFGRLNSVAQFAAHPQLRTVEAETPAGSIRLPADPLRWADEAGEQVRRVPALGEHTVAVRAEFGAAAQHVKEGSNAGSRRLGRASED